MIKEGFLGSLKEIFVNSTDKFTILINKIDCFKTDGLGMDSLKIGGIKNDGIKNIFKRKNMVKIICDSDEFKKKI